MQRGKCICPFNRVPFVGDPARLSLIKKDDPDTEKPSLVKKARVYILDMSVSDDVALLERICNEAARGWGQTISDERKWVESAGTWHIFVMYMEYWSAFSEDDVPE